MRAIIAKQLGPPKDLVIEDIDSLVPGPGQVVVDNKAAAINFPDLLVMEGKYQVRPPLPFSPGKEGAGIVKSVGEGVDRLVHDALQETGFDDPIDRLGLGHA